MESIETELDKREIPYVIVISDNILWNKYKTEEAGVKRQLTR